MFSLFFYLYLVSTDHAQFGINIVLAYKNYLSFQLADCSTANLLLPFHFAPLFSAQLPPLPHPTPPFLLTTNLPFQLVLVIAWHFLWNFHRPWIVGLWTALPDGREKLCPFLGKNQMGEAVYTHSAVYYHFVLWLFPTGVPTSFLFGLFCLLPKENVGLGRFCWRRVNKAYSKYNWLNKDQNNYTHVYCITQINKIICYF